ncbi:hypothetical protein LMG28138_05548 [Pararobbsia alpina]|uniref:Uncharacterized protein n=1 Tax=Pararobbsia alpina TaxID=621374 RepID=A0A6S7BLD6_9BURK|nr:hypothetical protein LMG28138_05548 [Pararobbsia alpina]
MDAGVAFFCRHWMRTTRCPHETIYRSLSGKLQSGKAFHRAPNLETRDVRTFFVCLSLRDDLRVALEAEVPMPWITKAAGH